MWWGLGAQPLASGNWSQPGNPWMRPDDLHSIDSTFKMKQKQSRMFEIIDENR
jgi:hypothetical protein